MKHGKPGGRNGENGEPKGEPKHRGGPVRRKREEKERKKQTLSSQNPKLKRTKECENSGGQKVCRRHRKVRPEQPREARNESRRQG